MLKKTYYHIVVCFLVVTLSISASGQSERPGIKVQARATDRSVKLRWAPSTPTAWQFANKYGYTIERVPIAENGQMIQRPVKVVLRNVPFKPAPQQNWEMHMDSDDYVAIAAQAIFGETFELTNNYRSDMMQVMNKVSELESRFSFALFSADQSIKAAELSGLYFEDETVTSAVRYLYRIYANVPEHILAIDTGFVYVGLQDYKPLPKVRDVRAQFDDHIAMISWNGALMENVYNSFWVERSEDGKAFNKISDNPIINTFSGERPQSANVFRMDTLQANEKKYCYRVIGINAFGENGPPSDTVCGQGIPGFHYAASVTQHSISNEGHVTLEWTFPSPGNSLLHSFQLFRVNQKTKAFEEVINHIDKSQRSVTDTVARSSNYYVVRSRDRFGRSLNSFPYLVQLEDSIPPSTPIDLTGRVDTLGRVFLSWKANSEDDLEGYHLYRSNFHAEEFLQVPGPILQSNEYVDTIKLNNLTEQVHYKLQAVDKRFNRSEFSITLTLKKPDLIPPVSPVFTGIKSDSTGISISWKRSDSEDVIEHALYRKEEQEADWTLLKVIPAIDSSSYYYDKAVTHRTSYAYTILAIDDAGLESPPAEPLTTRWISENPYPKIENIFYTIDKSKKTIRISWEYNQQNVEKFLIYKAKNGQPLTLFKSIDAPSLELKDDFVLDNNIEYRIVAAFKTGERTKLSKPLLVKM